MILTKYEKTLSNLIARKNLVEKMKENSIADLEEADIMDFIYRQADRAMELMLVAIKEDVAVLSPEDSEFERQREERMGLEAAQIDRQLDK